MDTLSSYGGIPIYDSNAPGSVVAPCPISTYSVLTVPAYWRAVNFLADNLASFPRCVHKDGSPPGVPHPLDRATLGRRPNGYQNATQFWRTLYFHAAHHGNGFAEITRTPAGVQLHNREPGTVSPFRFDAGDGRGLQQYYAYVNGPEKRVIPAGDMVHLMTLSHEGMTGIDPTRLHSETFQRAKTLDRHMTRYLMKGTIMRGAIQIPGGVPDERVQEIVNTLRTYFQGADADRDVIVLSDGASLNNATLSPQESQIVQQGAYTTKQIAQITGVPPEFLFELGEAKYNNSVELMGSVVVRYTFRPWIEQAENELTVKLLSTAEQDAGYSVQLDPDALLRGDTQTQTNVAVALKNAGIASTNEARAALSYPPDPSPESDKLKTLGDAQPQPPQPTAQTPSEAPNPPQKASQTAWNAFTALRPVLDAAIERVEDKAGKAFAAKEGKPPEERTVWGNVFAEQQARDVADVLTPVSDSLKALGAAGLPVAAIAARYSGAIKRRATTGESKPLLEIVTEAIGGAYEQQ